MEDNNAVDIEIHVPNLCTPDNSYAKVSGDPNKILGVVASIMFRTAMQAGYSLDDLLEVTNKSFTSWHEEQKTPLGDSE